MKKVLILTFHYPPSKAVAAKRALAYANYFHEYGIFPTILTHQYTEEGLIEKRNTEPDVEVYKTHRVIRLSQHPTYKSTKLVQLKIHSLTRRVILLFQWITGSLDVAIQNDHSYARYYDYLQDHCLENTYNYVIAIYNPHFTLKLAYLLSKKHDIPYILDFRDLWSRHIIENNTSISLSTRIQDFFTKLYWRRWIVQSDNYAITSQEWLNILERFTRKKGHIITNGFENELLDIKTTQSAFFSIGCMGTFYPGQDIITFCSGLRDFISELPTVERSVVRLECLGLSTNYRKSIMQELRNQIPDENLFFYPRGSSIQAFEFCKSQAILWHPAFPKVRGWFSAKIYDYLASQRPLLFAPTDEGIVETELNGLSHALFCKNSEEVKSNLSQLFKLWKQNKLDNIVAPTNEILKFSRSNQSQKMARLLLKRV